MDRVRSSGFPTTAWTVVSRARNGADSEAREALAFLCAAYWLPLYSFARQLGNASDDALDLTQAYFALLIEKDYVADVRLREGRFRAFLLTSFRHFISKERDPRAALKRGAGVRLSSTPPSEGRTLTILSTSSIPKRSSIAVGPSRFWSVRWLVSGRSLPGRVEGPSSSSSKPT